jgi:hypothetical protein
MEPDFATAQATIAAVHQAMPLMGRSVQLSQGVLGLVADHVESRLAGQTPLREIVGEGRSDAALEERQADELVLPLSPDAFDAVRPTVPNPTAAQQAISQDLTRRCDAIHAFFGGIRLRSTGGCEGRPNFLMEKSFFSRRQMHFQPSNPFALALAL